VRIAATAVFGLAASLLTVLSGAELRAQPAPTPEAAEAAPNVIVPPRPSGETAVPYPAGAAGDAVVILELLVAADGAVAEASVVTGDEPFASAAKSAASGWSFQPATRNGNAMAARIRFEVRFVAPRVEPEQPPAPGVTPSPGAFETEARPAPPPEPPPVDEVTVIGEIAPERKSLSRTEVRQLPGAFGDPFRAIEALPGVSPIISGLPYFYVRGAPPGNVGYFFDHIRLPTLYHAAIGPGVVHPAFVERVDLYAGPYPARYGRFAGGVVTAESARPEYRLRGEASVRLVDAGGMLEAPFADGRGSAMLAGRYSYTAAIVSLIAPDFELSYWDYQARLSYALGRDDTLEFFGFGSSDYAAQEDTDGTTETIFDVGFHRADLRWDRRVGPVTNLRLALTLGRDGSDFADEFRLQSDLLGLRSEVEHGLGRRARIRFGTDVELATYDVFRVEEPNDDDDEEIERLLPSRQDVTAGAFVDLLVDVGHGISLKPGLRADMYSSDGTAVVGVDPRLMADFRISRHVTLSHGLGIAHQRQSFVIPVPGFQPALEARLQTSVQSSAGINLEFAGEFKASATLFQSMHIDINDPLGTSRLDTEDQDIDFDDPSLGSSRGVELMLQRPLTNRLGGFVSYTLTRSERSVGRASGPSTFDRTHVLNLALGYELGRRWRVGGRLVFYTGIPGEVAYAEAARYPPRTAPFYRIDWRLEKRWLIGDSGAWWALVFEVLNTTLHKEVINRSCSAYVCREQEIGPVTIPSIGAEASF
jgi:TonB family protein